MDYASFLIQTLNGIQQGLLLFLVASGLTLIFGIMGVINLAHGSFYMIGAYLVFFLAEKIGNLWLAIIVGLALTVALGYIIEKVFINRLYKRDHLDQVLFTYGLILIFEQSRSILLGDDVYSVAIPKILNSSIQLSSNLSYPVYRLFISAVCIAVAAGMYWLIQKTKLGMTIRAGASNRQMAQSLGIDINRLFALVFAAGVALAAFAGMIAAPVNTVFPGMGNQVIIICFVAVVIGGIGSVKGAFFAALIIGLVDTFGRVLAPQLAGIAVYLLMAVVLLWRPEGLFKRT